MNESNYNIEEMKKYMPIPMINEAIDGINKGKRKKPNCIWLETSGCFGEIVSFLNGEDPDAIYFLTNMVNLTFCNSIMADQGETSYEEILKTLDKDEELIFIVDGAIPLIEECAVVARHKDRDISALEAVKTIGEKADYIIAAGTCASYGGPTAARPNVTNAVSLSEALNNTSVINVPGCPLHPIWLLGTIGYILNFGPPFLDNDQRPITFYGKTVHDICPRRNYFDDQVFATKYGDKECMFQLGCRGPITRADCPLIRWNESDNWPIGDNTTCIGCARKGFPDEMEPFIRY